MPTPPPITLAPLNRANFRACIDLKVAPDQESYVAPNLYSIAQSKVEPTWTPLAITTGDTVVGFVMYGLDVENGQWWIIRMMIGADHQGHGYGHAAMYALIHRLSEREGADSIFLGCVLGNTRAKHLYAHHGFRDTGDIEDNEAIMRLDLPQPSHDL